MRDEKHELRKETRKEKERRRETEEGDKRGEKRSVGGRGKKQKKKTVLERKGGRKP